MGITYAIVVVAAVITLLLYGSIIPEKPLMGFLGVVICLILICVAVWTKKKYRGRG